MALPRASKSRSQRRSSTRGLLIFALLLAGGAARAAAPDRCQVDRSCREKTEQAAQLAGQTRYDEALRLYQDAYATVQEPRLLVNIGRCYYRLGQARKALEFYDAFQKAEPEPEPELAGRLKQFRSDAQAAIVADGGASEPASSKTEAPAKPDRASEVAESEPAPAAQPAPRELGPARPLWRIGVGVGALALGGVLVGLGAGALSVDGACAQPSELGMNLCTVMSRPDGTQTTLLIDSKGAGAGLLVAGGLLVVGGVVLIALPGRRAKVAQGLGSLRSWPALTR